MLILENLFLQRIRNLYYGRSLLANIRIQENVKWSMNSASGTHRYVVLLRSACNSDELLKPYSAAQIQHGVRYNQYQLNN